MSKSIGSYGWLDLTVPNASKIKDFYARVIGYEVEAVDMGDYSDFCMLSPTDRDVKCGICHARGINENIPVVWMVYFNVENLEERLTEVERMGGKVISAIRKMGEDKYCFIQDPAGAYCALYEHR